MTIRFQSDFINTPPQRLMKLPKVNSRTEADQLVIADSFGRRLIGITTVRVQYTTNRLSHPRGVLMMNGHADDQCLDRHH